MRRANAGINVYIIAIIVVLASVFIIFRPPEKLFYRDPSGAVFMTDFIIYHSAGLVFNSSPEKIYSNDEYRINYSQATGLPENSFAQYAAYLYPPYGLALYAPLAKLPLMDAYYLWRALSGICTFWLVYLLIGGTSYKKSAVIYSYIVAIASPPLLDTLNTGQPTILLPLGIIIFQLLAKTRYVVPACMILILTTLKPHLTLAPILYLLITNYNKRLFYSLTSAAILVFAICGTIFGFDIWQQYLSAITSAPEKMHSFIETEISMANMRTILLMLLGSENFGAIQPISLLIWLATVAASIYAAFAVKALAQKTRDIIFAMVIIASCVFGLWTHISSLTLLLIPLAYMLKYSSKYTIYIAGGIILSLNLLPRDFWPIALATLQLLLLGYFYFMLTKNGKKNDFPATSTTGG